MPDVSAKQIRARDILLTNDCTAKTAYTLAGGVAQWATSMLPRDAH